MYSLHICFFPGFGGFCVFGLLGEEDFSPKLAPLSHVFDLVVNFGGGMDLLVCLEDLFVCRSSGFRLALLFIGQTASKLD